MGCFVYDKKLNQENIEVLIDKKRDSNYLNNKLKLDLSEVDKKVFQLKDNYYENLNDEQALINYLTALKNNRQMNEYESELLLYFDVLSADNRTIFTGINDFVPSINIFRQVIQYLSDFDYQEIKKMDYYARHYDICGRIKFINSQDFSNTNLKTYFSNEKNDYDDGIKILLKKRRLEKISLLSNYELYFNLITQYYFEMIEKSDENHLTVIGLITRHLSDTILKYLELIQNGHKFSRDDVKIIDILLYAPIIGNYKYSSILKLISNLDYDNGNEKNDDKSNDIMISEDKLIINYIYKRKYDKKEIESKYEFENAFIYNIKLIKNEIIDEKKKPSLTKINLLKYVKMKYFQENNFYTHNKDYWNFNKGLFEYILNSETIKTLFKSLYPNRLFIFEKKEIVNQLIESIVFIPYELYESYGYTSKKELMIFIEGIFKGFSKPIHFLSKSASFIILGIHEGCGHWASSFYSIYYQDISLFNSTISNKEILEEIKFEENNESLSSFDGGDMLELMLFGQKLDSFSIKEILFLLCKSSYDVDYKTFNKNFKKVSKIKFDVLLDNASKDLDFCNIMKTFNIDKDYFKKLMKGNNYNYKFKRNGDILIKSKCGELRF